MIIPKTWTCRKCKEKFCLDDFDPMEGLCNGCYKLEWGELPQREQDANCTKDEEVKE